MGEFDQMRTLLKKLHDLKKSRSTFAMVDLALWLEGENGQVSDLDRMGYLIDQAESDFYNDLQLASDHTIKEVA